MRRNASIQGLRGLAVLMVFFYHLHHAAITGGFTLFLSEGTIGYDIAELGMLGVDLFFMISGYLICASLVKHGSALQFLKNRAIRIYPAFLIPHLIVFTVGPMIGYQWMANLSVSEYLLHFCSNLLFLPGVFPLPIAQIVAWSLSYEFAFYLLAASAFAIHRKISSTWIKALLVLCWLTVTTVALREHPRAWFFVAGAVSFALTRNRPLSDGYTLRLSPLGIVTITVMALTFHSHFTIAVLAGMIGFLTIVRESGLLSVILRLPILQYLGDISYSLYLWHVMVMFVTKRVFGSNGSLLPNPILNFVLFTVVTAGLSVAVSHVSFRFVETACSRRFSRRKSSDPNQATTARIVGTKIGDDATTVDTKKAA